MFVKISCGWSVNFFFEHKFEKEYDREKVRQYWHKDSHITGQFAHDCSVNVVYTYDCTPLYSYLSIVLLGTYPIPKRYIPKWPHFTGFPPYYPTPQANSYISKYIQHASSWICRRLLSALQQNNLLIFIKQHQKQRDDQASTHHSSLFSLIFTH